MPIDVFISYLFFPGKSDLEDLDLNSLPEDVVALKYKAQALSRLERHLRGVGVPGEVWRFSLNFFFNVFFFLADTCPILRPVYTERKLLRCFVCF